MLYFFCPRQDLQICRLDGKTLSGNRKFYDRRTKLGGEIGTFKIFDFFVNRSPLVAFLYLALLTHGGFIAISLVMQGIVVPLSHQWYSALFGDLLLDALCAICIFALKTRALRRPIFNKRCWHWAVLTFWLGFGLTFFPREHVAVGSWIRQLGPMPLYHALVVCPTLGYAVTVLVIAAFKMSYTKTAKCIVGAATVLCLAGWLGLGRYDSSHQFAPGGVSKFAYSAPPDGWRNVRKVIERFR